MKATHMILGVALAAMAVDALAGGDAAAGKGKAQACVACHNADGNSADPQYPKLAGQHASYLVQALKDYKSGARKNPIMSGFAASLSAEDQADLAAWFSSQSGLKAPDLPAAQ